MLQGDDWRGEIPGISGGVDVGGEILFPAFAMSCTKRSKRSGEEPRAYFMVLEVFSNSHPAVPGVVHTGTTLLLAKAILAHAS